MRSLNGRALDRILQEIEALPPLPQAAAAALEALRDPETPLEEALEAMSCDPSLTAGALRMCNSAFTGLRRRVGTLREAAVYLGRRGLLEVVTASVAKRYLEPPLAGYALAEGELWRHSVACSLAARSLQPRLGAGAHSELAFTASLLHDIGKVVLNAFVAESLGRILQLVRDKGLTFLEAERWTLGVDHAQVGGLIARRWSFPPELASAIEFHHQPCDPLSGLVHLADAVVLQMGIGAGADGLAYALQSQLDEEELQLEEVVLEVWEGLRAAEDRLNVSGG